MKPKNDKYNNGNNKNGDSDSMSVGGEDQGSRSPSRSGRSSDGFDHDALSIYIGNVDYSATEEELRNAFIGCGDIVRVTIIKNMRTGHPKGAAFIEFTDKDGVHAAMTLNGKQVKGRPLTVTSKKPRPENRKREPRPSYERRAPPMHSNYGGQSRAPYMGNSGPPQSSRGGYYSSSQGHYDNRRPPMQMEQPQHSRYDPYRRPDFYDPYMQQPRGAPMPPHQPNYYHQSNKFQNGGEHSRSSYPAPPRYSNPYHRK